MPNKKWFWNDSTDGLLRRLYDPTVRGRSQEITGRWVLQKCHRSAQARSYGPPAL